VLGNKSPRAAVKTPKGRAKVVDWLKTLENHTAKFAGSNDEMASYNTMIKCGRSTSGASRMTSTGWQQSLLGNGAVQRARPLPRHLHPLSNLYCNINNIRVRSFILTGAPAASTI